MTITPGRHRPDGVHAYTMHAYTVVQQPTDIVGNATVFCDGEPWLRDIEWDTAERIVTALAQHSPPPVSQPCEPARWERLDLDHAGLLRPGDVLVATEWGDDTEWTFLVDRPLATPTQ